MRWVCLNMAYTQIFTSSNYQVDRDCRVRRNGTNHSGKIRSIPFMLG